MEKADVDHFMDLLELLPWEVDQDGKGYHIPRGSLWDSLDEGRWSLLSTSQLHYGRLRDGRGNDSVVSATCAYMLGVFDAAPTDLVTAIGVLIVGPLNLEPGSCEAAGRRWCDDLASTAWRLAVSHGAEFRRMGRA